ncbi:MAG: acyl carrier protein [Bacilli bacterium]|nr:acyl carrier protein [Bacilli bacterium]
MVFEKVKKIIAKELNLKEEEIQVNSRFAEDLGADSLDAVELIMAIEEEFDVQVSDEAAQNIRKVSDIVEYLESI